MTEAASCWADCWEGCMTEAASCWVGCWEGCMTAVNCLAGCLIADLISHYSGCFCDGGLLGVDRWLFC